MEECFGSQLIYDVMEFAGCASFSFIFIDLNIFVNVKNVFNGPAIFSIKCLN